eukprot:1014278-Rhodomonas_salina.1
MLRRGAVINSRGGAATNTTSRRLAPKPDQPPMLSKKKKHRSTGVDSKQGPPGFGREMFEGAVTSTFPWPGIAHTNREPGATL